MLRRRGGAALLAAVVVGLLGGLAWLGTWPPMTTVESDSMSPTLGVGDLLLLRPAEEVAVGDVVVVPVPRRLQAERDYPERLAHRVVAVEDGQVSTKGDQQSAPDPFTVPVEAVGQRVLSAIPFAGHALAFVRSPVGMIWLIGGLVLLAVRERQPDEESVPATVADLEALRADLTELLGAQPEASAEAGTAQQGAVAAESATSSEPAPPEPAEPAPAPAGEPEPDPIDVTIDSGWPAPLRPSPGRRAAVRASKVGTATRRSLAELARARRDAPDAEDDDASERSA